VDSVESLVNTAMGCYVEGVEGWSTESVLTQEPRELTGIAMAVDKHGATEKLQMIQL
jgi:hypothetical protein